MGDEWDRQHADHRSGRRVCIEDDVNIVWNFLFVHLVTNHVNGDRRLSSKAFLYRYYYDANVFSHPY